MTIRPLRIRTEDKAAMSTINEAPLLELSRCKHCGEYVAIAEVTKEEDGSMTYQPITTDDDDMFDLEDTTDTGSKYLVFGTSDRETEFDNNVPYLVTGNRLENVTSLRPVGAGWHLIANVQCQCPYCGKKLTKQTSKDEDNPDMVQNEEEDAKKLQKFRVAADFVSRLIAPSTLDLMTEAKPKQENKISLHNGQQYISFVDSRQMAARSTIKQNLEEERMWIYGTIFHELCRRATAGCMTKEEAMRHYEEIYDNTGRRDPQHIEADKKLEILEGDDQKAIDELSETFCEQFAERSELSPELDKDGNIKPEVKRKYILAIMVDYLSHRPMTAATAETMGMFTSHYANLDPAYTNELPETVTRFNDRLSKENQITQRDWHDLMQMFLDFNARQNECVFLTMDEKDPVDIFQCIRFATKKDQRRPVRKPVIHDKVPQRNRLACLLAKLIATEKNIAIKDAISKYKEDIQEVMDCLWDELINRYRLLEHSMRYNEEEKLQVKDRDIVKDGVHETPYRLNLVNLGFKLYDEVYLCDANTGTDIKHVEKLRPVDVHFHGYSPFVIGGQAMPLNKERYEKWAPFGWHNHSENPNPTDEEINEWAKTNRSLLWKNNLWGENGLFADRLLQIHQFPQLFIQAEHTAQVDKMVSRKVQTDFKDHCINILACSTTMEMGVDLGDLELVMMTSVPPMPSNYKQRAGRSGRRGQVRSACVTLCGSDAVGIRTMLNPMDNVIMRPVSTPTVDLNSIQVIQRHVNSFLVREFGVFKLAGGSINEQVLDYYTKYQIVPDGDSNHCKIKRLADNSPVCPMDGLGDETGTPYEKFNNMCTESISNELKRKLKMLLDGTILGNRPVQNIVAKAREMNENCYAELELRIQDYADPYKNAKSAKQQAFFEMKFIEPLASRLLSYWATHRFIPNANMPVNVIDFDINSASLQSYRINTPSNPSYPLRTALSQYAPGNPIARDGIVRIVRGIRYSNFFKPEVTFKQLYYNKEQVVMDFKDELKNTEKWRVSGTTELDLLQPAEFIPDMNESASRILDQREFTRVSAQLIGADEWKQDRIEPHLFDTRSSRESGNGQILYYNEGIGYGYCHCTKCGKTVLEHWAAASCSDPEKLPSELIMMQAKDSDKPDFHFSLVKKDGKAVRCVGSLESIKRNVVLGDTIQTDYTEIRIRHLNKNWINARKVEENLLITLGLLFTRALAEELNVERTDLDFTITPNGHLCIFDANPGGSGYSNQLASMDMMKLIIERSAEIIDAAERTGNKEALIDRFTLYYITHIDIKAAKAWIQEECNARNVLPEQIVKVFGKQVTETSLAKLERAFINSDNEVYLFVDDEYAMWEYEGTDHSWRNQFISYFGRHRQEISFCVAENRDSRMPEHILNTIRSIKGWANEVYQIKNPYAGRELYPLAYIDGRLYFTNNPNHITMNDRWGNGTIYYIKANNFAIGAHCINTDVEKNMTKIFKLTDEDPLLIKTNELGNIIYSKSSNIIDSFVAHCKENVNADVRFVYQDEHLKSGIGMILTLQTITYFAKMIGRDFSLEFKTERYVDPTGKYNSVTANQPSHVERNELLDHLAGDWASYMGYEHDLECQLNPIESMPRNALEHWRALSIECSGKKLMIYPDGGLMNGWSIAQQPNGERYFRNTLTHDDVIYLSRNMDLKFDITIEELLANS